jgi:hypothetical protein
MANMPTFRIIVVPLSSVLDIPGRVILLDTKNEGKAVLLNKGNYQSTRRNKPEDLNFQKQCVTTKNLALSEMLL